MPAPLLISPAEAAFIAGLTERQLSRVVDESLIPEFLFERRSSNRLFTRLGAALAQFYFATEGLLIASARKLVLEELCARLDKSQAKNEVLKLMRLDSMSWQVERICVAVDVFPLLHEASLRAQEVDQAHAVVSEDPDVMGGVPVFKGTRVPIGIVLGSLAAGVDDSRLKASYAFLTAPHIRSAKVYQAVHPRRGRPRRLAETSPELGKPVTRTTLRASNV